MEVISDYKRFEKDKLYMDSILGCVWKLTERTEQGAVLQNISSKGVPGVKITVEPETTRLSFYPV